MFPILNIGPFAIQAGGLILLLSFFIGAFLSSKLATNLSTNADAIENSLLLGLISGLLGARVGFMLVNPAVFTSNPLNLISLTPSMLDASFGALVGSLTGVILAQKKHLPLWPTLDSLTPFVIMVFAGLHLSNFAIGVAFGLPTDLPWGVNLWNEVRHPVQVYTLILTTILVGWVLWRTSLLKVTGFLHSGVLFLWVSVGLAGLTLITRAFIADKVLLGPIDFYQLVALLVMIASLVLIYKRTFTGKSRVGVIISMGSNLNPNENIIKGIEIIGSTFRIRRKSAQYITQDINRNPKTAHFINQVIEIETDLPYPDLRTQLKRIEKNVGRQPGNKQRVALDLDILTYGDEVFSWQGKKIPAPEMQKYPYIAQPLAEMSPNFKHPANGIGIQEILDKMEHTTHIRRIDEVENGIKR